MVDTAKAHADHEDDREAERYGEIGKCFVSCQRNAPTTCAFHQRELSVQRQHSTNRLGQRRDTQLDTSLASGQMRRYRRLESHRIDLFVAQRQCALTE